MLEAWLQVVVEDKPAAAPEAEEESEGAGGLLGIGGYGSSSDDD